MPTTTIAQNVVLLEMKLVQNQSDFDIDNTTGQLHDFHFSAYSYLQHTSSTGQITLQPTDDSPAGGTGCQWRMEYPLDMAIPFKVRKEHMRRDISEALEGLPRQFHEVACQCATEAFAELKNYSQEPISDISAWFSS